VAWICVLLMLVQASFATANKMGAASYESAERARSATVTKLDHGDSGCWDLGGCHCAAAHLSVLRPPDQSLAIPYHDRTASYRRWAAKPFRSPSEHLHRPPIT
jgi:hypothetical protein